MKALLDNIEKDSRENPPEAASLVCLGDYVDRGPHSKHVVRTLIRGLPSGFRVTLLKGNHEDLLLSFLRNPYAGLNWHGGVTFFGYGGTGSRHVPVRVKLPVGAVPTAVGAGPMAPVSFAIVRQATP